MEKIKLAIVDDHEIVRFGMKMLFDSEENIELVAIGSSGKDAIKIAEEIKPDILILDINMPDMSGLEAIEIIKKKKPDTKVLFLSMFDREDYVLKAVESGAHGYLLKDTEKEVFLKALNTIMLGDKYFSSEISGIIVNQYLNTKTKEKKSSGVNILNIVNNEFNLSRRELDILSRICKGDTNKAISEECDISIRTIEKHRLNIMKKMNVNNASDMMRMAIEKGLMDIRS